MNGNPQVTPYGDQTSKKGQVTSMFDKIAPYYDQLNRLLSLGVDIWWRRKAIRLLKGLPCDKILDIATGTGDLAIEAAKVLKPGHITGMDISANMLQIGDEKILKAGLGSKIKFEIGDSEHLRYSDDHFDIVTAAFGVRNFENLEAGLAEMYRVMRVGGTLMVLEFSKPKVFPLKQGFNAYFKYLLPVIGRIKSKDPKAYQYLYESVQAFPDYQNFTDILTKLGYKESSFKPLSGGICTIYLAKK
jgi:demethylmenaquinone methyltransferase / 2-methoxy-6-polyprenyl-1,4-benzoquinol methylase